MKEELIDQEVVVTETTAVSTELSKHVQLLPLLDRPNFRTTPQ